MNLSFNLLNSSILKLDEQQHLNRIVWQSDANSEKKGEVFFSKRLIEDSNYRTRQSKIILERSKLLREQIDKCKFF